MGLPAEIIKNLNTTEEYDTVSLSRSRQALKQLNLLHDKDDGFITIAVKDNKKNEWLQYHYKKEQLENNIFKILGLNIDTYMSINSFYVPKRSVECIRHINSLYIDIDAHCKNKINVDSILYFLQEDFFDIEIPKANLIIQTGRGLALYWILENLPSQGLPLWTLVQEQFYKKIKEIESYIKNIEVDPSTLDISRVFRIAGSKNTKSNTLAKIYFYDQNKYRLDEIVKEYLPSLEIIKNKKKKKLTDKQKKVSYFYTIYNLHYSRLLDVAKLQRIRNGKCNGHREFMCFLYRYYSCLYTKNDDMALENTIQFNSNFSEPLSRNEVITATVKAEGAFQEWLKNEPVIKNGRVYKRGGYNYTSTKLIKLLDITNEEQKQLKTIICTEEKYKRNNIKRKISRRNEEGLTLREQHKNEKIKEIKELINKGFNKSKVAKELGLNRSTITRSYSYLFK